MGKKERKRDGYLQRTYNMTLAEYNLLLKKQHGKCAGCLKPAEHFKKGLHVDHWHALAKVKVKAERLADGRWRAYNVGFDKYGYLLLVMKFRYVSRNKKKAIRAVKQMLKRKANRGLVCWPCNSGLHRWDDPDKLRRVSVYMDNYFKRLKG